MSAVRNTLESRGVLAKLRADLRLAVFTAIDAKERENGVHMESKSLDAIKSSVEAQQLVGLIADFCSCMGLPTTRSCLLAETGMTVDTVPLRASLQGEFGAAATLAHRVAAADPVEDARVYGHTIPLLLHCARVGRHAAALSSAGAVIDAPPPPRSAAPTAPAVPRAIDVRAVVDVDSTMSPRLSPAHASPMNASSASSEDAAARAAPPHALNVPAPRDASAFFARTGGGGAGMEFSHHATHDVSEASASGIDVSSSIEVGSPSDVLRRSTVSAARAAALPPMPVLTAPAVGPPAADSVYSAGSVSDVPSQAHSGSENESRVGFMPTQAVEAALPGGVSSITKSLGLGSDLFRLARDLHDAADNADAAAAVLAAHSHEAASVEPDEHVAHAAPAKNADDLDAELEALLAAGLEGDLPPPPPPPATAAVPVAAAAIPPPQQHAPLDESSSFSESSPPPAVTRTSFAVSVTGARNAPVKPLAGAPARDRSSATYGDDDEDVATNDDDDDDVNVSRHALKAASAAAVAALSPAKVRPAPAPAPAASPRTADDSYGYDEDFESSDAEGRRPAAPAQASASPAPAPALPASPRAESIAEELEEDIVVEDEDVAPPPAAPVAVAATTNSDSGAGVKIYPFMDSTGGELFARGMLEVASRMSLEEVHALLSGADTMLDLDEA